MIDDMGIFRTTVEFSPWHDHSLRRQVRDVMVDTGSEYTWLPRTLLGAVALEGLNLRVDVVSLRTGSRGADAGRNNCCSMTAAA